MHNIFIKKNYILLIFYNYNNFFEFFSRINLKNTISFYDHKINNNNKKI